jgi:(E)-4-hydroxy-3-methylbut-2-enyl-diphosphate synthase
MKIVKIGDCVLDGEKIYIQSMLNGKNAEENVKQAVALELAGCQILRVAIPDKAALVLIPLLKNKLKIPVVADIHFDYKLALAAVDMGIDKIRINPGNIGEMDKTRAVARACKLHNIPIRIGVNGGSLEKKLLADDNLSFAEKMVMSAENQIKILEDCDFDDIVVSLKVSNLQTMINAYRLARLGYNFEKNASSQKNSTLYFDRIKNYPLHLGVTEAGTAKTGLVKSAVGIGSLLVDGIGETIRVSLSADPIMEIAAAVDILNVVGKYEKITVVSCPTCGRTSIDVINLANQVEELTKNIKKKLTIAVMGCVVNGLGEGAAADIGVAGGNKKSIIFKKGVKIKTVDNDKILEELLNFVENEC